MAGGLGVALLPRVTVGAELASGALVELPWEPPFQLYTQVAWRAGKRLPRHLTLFIEAAVRLVREQTSYDGT